MAGFAIWFTGIPASGKTTLAKALQAKLKEQGIATHLLDSDELRSWLTPQPTYSAEERDWFYRVLNHIALMLVSNNVNVLVAATAARRVYRDCLRIQVSRFAEIYVDTPLKVCRNRDPKGLYARSEAGEIDNLPGIDALYEVPQHPEIVVSAENPTATNINYIFNHLNERQLWTKS